MKYIGVRICPTCEAVSRKVEELRERLGAPRKQMSIAEQLEYHRGFTLYTNFYLGFSTGMRARISPIPRPCELSPLTRALLVVDKGWPRLNLIVGPVSEQLTYYSDHIAKMHSFNTRGEASFWYTPDGADSLRPKLLAEYMKSIGFGFPPAIYRRFVFNELLDRGCPPEVVRITIMGHAVVGDEPAGKHSTFLYGEAFRILRPYIIKLLEDLHFRPLKSVLR